MAAECSFDFGTIEIICTDDIVVVQYCTVEVEVEVEVEVIRLTAIILCRR
ncbi:hypothetical protein BofuT4_uP116240.1 [Botrytis cinerea T4]|uniref:Uncharacterized protein n=1 Tax=Botryotinia fuckeliana (strain T4) TaxID=999810 RepID=G2Y0A9_BOTF4|nr:hypothetical protein BofuT4_uP116240.1 [Botrytis cinerea T4]